MILSPQQVRGVLFIYCAQISAKNIKLHQSYGLKSEFFKSCGAECTVRVRHAFLLGGGARGGAQPGTLFMLIGSSQNFTQRGNQACLIYWEQNNQLK